MKNQQQKDIIKEYHTINEKNNIYVNPHIVIYFTDKSTLYKYFDTLDEVDNWVKAHLRKKDNLILIK